MDQSLSDSVLVQLAKDVHPNNMTNLGVHLGFGIARIEQFRHNNPRDVLKAMVDMLHDYRDEKMQGFDESVTCTVKKLCEALKKADSEEVARKMESGKYRPTTTRTGLGMYIPFVFHKQVGRFIKKGKNLMIIL